MRRLVLLFLMAVLLFAAAFAPAESVQPAVDAIFDAFLVLNSLGTLEKTEFSVDGEWVSAVMGAREAGGQRWYAFVYDQAREAFVTWDDVFVDGDAAAERIAQIAERDTYKNAYAEHNRVTPVPRDNFAFAGGVITIHYPAEQLAHFSGRAGAFSFYAYELAGLFREGVPLWMGDSAMAAPARDAALEAGALPGYENWAIGGAMADAADALGLVDVPDLTYDFAVYHFEDPRMRGVALLSDPGEDSARIATISGIYAERMDFSGLCTGVSTLEECVAALGAPDGEGAVDFADGYSLRPIGRTLRWEGQGRALELHFAEGILQSVLLR